MKQKKFVFLMLAVCVLAFNSCKKSSTKPKVAAQNISLKANGTAYSSATPIAIYSKTGGTLLITGAFSATSTVVLGIGGITTTGTFDITSGTATASYVTGTTLQDAYLGTSGNIVVTSFTSTTVAGTFAFTGTNLATAATETITSGQFSANYTSQ